MDTLAPFARAASLAALLTVAPVAAQDAGRFVTGDLAALRAAALAEANADRREAGLAPLEPGAVLDEIAQAHAHDMLARDYFSHASPDGEGVGARFREAGGSRSAVVAENLATCTGCPIPPTRARVEAFEAGWMDSPEHRENLLRRGVARFGFGIAADPETERVVAVQTFAGPGVPRGLAAGEEPEPLDEAGRAAAAVDAVNGLRKAAEVAPLQASDSLTRAARSMLPEGGASPDAPALDLDAALPAGARADFGAVAVLAGTCSGCGATPTRTDVADFVAQWAESRRDRLTASGFDRLGFALGADGEGAKTAVLVLARSR
ncbi:CAP domain-containing protein [Salinarimonas sp.]|uniref:CAP domain-containing protein n=1 Tax=Salinarimonas sp. TaxID=2766526 RepID=UPI0032D8D848